MHPVGADVIVVQGRKPLGVAKVRDDNTFHVEIDDAVRGEIEVRLALINASAATANAIGDDIDVVLFYNGVNNFMAG